MYKTDIQNYLLLARCVIGLALASACFYASAQAPSLGQSFDVATVKIVPRDSSHPFNPNHFGPHVTSTGASYWNMSVRLLIGYAYGVDFFRVEGPEWTKVDRFDIEARFPEGTSKEEERRMLQSLLKDRFKASFHIEKKEVEGYALLVAKDGAKLKPAVLDPVHAATGENSDSKGYGTQTVKFDRETSTQHWILSKTTMHDLVERLGSCVDTEYRKVVDETGLQGDFQVEYDCPVGRRPLRAADSHDLDMPPDPQGGYPLTRSLSALGLKLEKRNVLQDVYVLDHIERPSANE